MSTPFERATGGRKPRSDDPVSIGDIVRELMQNRIFGRGIPIATLVRDWPEIVGQRLAEVTKPTALEAGVLTVAVVDGPWAGQIKFLSEQIRENAAKALGEVTIETVKVTVRPSLEKG